MIPPPQPPKVLGLQAWATTPSPLLCVFFGEQSVQIFCPFKNQIIRLFSYWVIQASSISCLLGTCQTDGLHIFSPICGLSLHFVDYFLCCTEAFQLDVTHLSIFALVACAGGVFFKKSLPSPMSWKVSQMFYFSSFVVWGLRFKSLIRFDLTLVYSERKGSSYILLQHRDIQFSQHHIWKRLSFPHCLFFSGLSKIV